MLRSESTLFACLPVCIDVMGNVYDERIVLLKIYIYIYALYIYEGILINDIAH